MDRKSVFRFLPIVASVSWSITVLVVLIYWLASGRPQLPGQSEPEIAYISDIGAHTIKPFFIIGCWATALSFSVLLLYIHWDDLRNVVSPQRSSWLRVCLVVGAVVTGLLGMLALALLSILDTYRSRPVHIPLLFIFCAAMLVSAACTAGARHHQPTVEMQRRDVLEREQSRSPVQVEQSDEKVLERSAAPAARWKFIIIGLIVLECVLVLAFVGLFSNGYYFAVGVLEWIIAAALAVYLWLTTVYIR